MNRLNPQEGRWYAYGGYREPFQIVNVDEDEGVIYYQDSHGDMDEMDIDEWYALDIQVADEHELHRIARERDDDDLERALRDGGNVPPPSNN